VTQRVVYDTNVWISGLLWRGKPYQCLLLARAGIVRPVYCPPMLAELSKKLRDTFRFSEDHIHAVVYELRQLSERVEVQGTLHVVPGDPDDDVVVECALVARVDTVVSSDKHLLAIGEHEGVRIVTPDAFLSMMSRLEQ
jgi:putative PIN family toxin of toxin-antitoxin system